MEERKISMTFKNDYQSVYSAIDTYSHKLGKLSKKHNLKRIIPSAIVSVLISVLIFVIEGFSFKTDYVLLIIFFLIMAGTLSVTMAISRSLAKSDINKLANLNFNYSFNASRPFMAQFDEKELFLMSGYSKVTVPYEEFDYVISDRINFIYSFGGDMKIRNIPKINQNPDDLFAIDNLLKEKIGDKFIYLM